MQETISCGFHPYQEIVGTKPIIDIGRLVLVEFFLCLPSVSVLAKFVIDVLRFELTLHLRMIIDKIIINQKFHIGSVTGSRSAVLIKCLMPILQTSASNWANTKFPI